MNARSQTQIYRERRKGRIKRTCPAGQVGTPYTWMDSRTVKIRYFAYITPKISCASESAIVQFVQKNN